MALAHYHTIKVTAALYSHRTCGLTGRSFGCGAGLKVTLRVAQNGPRPDGRAEGQELCRNWVKTQHPAHDGYAGKPPCFTFTSGSLQELRAAAGILRSLIPHCFSLLHCFMSVILCLWVLYTSFCLPGCGDDDHVGDAGDGDVDKSTV